MKKLKMTVISVLSILLLFSISQPSYTLEASDSKTSKAEVGFYAPTNGKSDKNDTVSNERTISSDTNTQGKDIPKDKSSVSSNKKAQGVFPKTGSIQNPFLMTLGSILVFLIVLILIKKRRKERG